MSEEKEYVNELLDSLLITLGAVGVSMLSKKSEPLTSTASINSFLKLATAAGVSSITVRYLQDKKYLPTTIIK